ncbi:MAG: CPBP family intramembrane metalloprotease [Methanosarcinaceae archaeon]|nr:CPBP family intramembrane metalloprotease [Methanosarcinaceae archaeon]MDD4331930.1 CPBP family intramembrane metalloprotease [Methanosarcinaceae archaeon]MDD4749727.1 CPBP family intramembrane metalloprotease [Methanosarcinaceae archaeon]
MPPEKLDFQNENLLIAIPIFFIAFAESLLFIGEVGATTWMHVGIVVALTFSTAFIKNRQINRIHQALTLLPLLRLINLSIPVFFEATLYSFLFIYGTLAIPVALVLRAQHLSREQMGLIFNKKRNCTLTILAIPFGFLLGYGEYSILHAAALIPNLSIINILKLTIIMVLFVGLIEEIIFRSILQTRLEESLGAKKGLILTSLLFGFMHSGYGTPYEMCYTAFVGLIIGYTFQKTRNLFFITLLHGFINVFLFGILPHLLPTASFF